MAFLMPSPISGAARSFITTVQVIPALINTLGGTCIRWMRTGTLCQADPGECGIDGGEELWTIPVILIGDASGYAQDGSLQRIRP